MSLMGFDAVVLSPTPSLPVLLGAWPGDVETLSSSAAGLRRLVGAGLLLIAVQAHALLDFAEHVRRDVDPDNLDEVKREMIE